MANPPKQKGTGYETEIERAGILAGFTARRVEPGLPWDVELDAKPSMAGHRINALATRPDYGRTLVTITLPDFLDVLGYRGYGARIECKRYRRFALHTIFEGKFSR